ncbi:diaminopimelate epimerase [Sphingomonas sp.]|jgi:diaminopimelate epimerase|uniref:diaminopimelate epimerase n=1 Tax=Sphingomonas sp. TaxID=28214 RepID=UPI002D8058B9|nr:diaminopimelate epimerase [Sphingomonas sp.]HEU0045358.1 diaminopimelate epimerase [Sphingomonas sp.]
MRLGLIKCHGSGNDFPLLDARAVRLDDEVWAAVAEALADRAGPVGGDGLLLLIAGDRNHAFGMRMFNSDGSEAELCLNGLRCVARLGFDREGLEEAAIRCKASTVQAARAPDLAPGVYTVREVAGPASLDVTGWPMNIGEVEHVDAPLSRLGSARAFTAVAMPNPHLVAFVEEIDEDELVAVGEAAQDQPAWMPNRANVSFVELREGGLFVRTYERGVGLTDSCGSAMAASTYAACLTGRIAFDTEITVWNKGGLVRADAEIGGEVTLSGNATWEWEGSVDIDPATGAVSDVQVDRRFADEAAAWEGARSAA